jgi:hypothetical protein
MTDNTYSPEVVNILSSKSDMYRSMTSLDSKETTPENTTKLQPRPNDAILKGIKILSS